MRQPLLILLLGLFVVVSFTSAGLKQRIQFPHFIQRIPNPVSSFWRGLKAGSSRIEKATNRIIANVGYTKSPNPRDTTAPEEETTPSPIEIVSVTGSSHSAQTSSGLDTTTYPHNPHTSSVDGGDVTSHIASSANGLVNQLNGRKRINTFKGTILVAIASDPDFNRNLTVKSANFPYERSTPITSSWDVKVRTKCRRALVTMTIDVLSRLSNEEKCSEGFYRVSPFMKQAKICGRIDTVPPFQWYVDDQEPEDVTISLKHNGLNDGYSEGLGFSLLGQCLPNDFNMTRSKAMKSYSRWLQQLSRDSVTCGYPTVVIPGVSLAKIPPPVTTTEGDLTDSFYKLNPFHGSEPPIQPISWTPTLNLNVSTNLPVSPTSYTQTTPSAISAKSSTIAQQLLSPKIDLQSYSDLPMQQAPDVPVDENLEEAISFITALLDKPIMALKPLAKQ